MENKIHLNPHPLENILIFLMVEADQNFHHVDYLSLIIFVVVVVGVVEFVVVAAVEVGIVGLLALIVVISEFGMIQIENKCWI